MPSMGTGPCLLSPMKCNWQCSVSRLIDLSADRTTRALSSERQFHIVVIHSTRYTDNGVGAHTCEPVYMSLHLLHRLLQSSSHQYG